MSREQISRVSRRGVLAAGAGAAAVSACSTQTRTALSERSHASASAPAGKTLVKLADIPVGEAIVDTRGPDGKPVVVARPSDSTAAAFSAICTHMGCTVKAAGKQLHCPCHGSRYDAVTGRVIHGPAPRSLPKVAVHVANGDVITGT